MPIPKVRGIVLVIAASLGLSLTGVALASAGPSYTSTPSASNPDCVVAIGNPSSERCYSSQSAARDAIAAGPQTTYVAAVDYSGTNYTGSSLTWTTPYLNCNPLTGNNMPAGWNDTVQSIIAYSGCATSIFWNANYGQPVFNIGVDGSASTLGSMNKQGSSQLFCSYYGCHL
jgi:hypothetical protein